MGIDKMEDNNTHLDNTELKYLKKLEFVVNNSPTIAITWRLEDNGWLIDYVSDNIDLLGLPKEDLVSNKVSYFDFLHPDDVWRIQENLKIKLKCDTVKFVQEYRLVSPEGKVCRVRDFNYIGRDEQNRITHMNSIVMDITEEKKLQEEMLQIKKMNAIGQLTGGIAHDFNNLLTGIMGNAELIEMESEDEEMQRLAKNILDICENASSLTQKLLSFSRNDKCINVDFCINEKVLSIQEMVSNIINRNITIKTEFSNEELILDGDPAEIGNVLLNMAINARDAMPDGGTLTFKTDIFHADQFYNLGLHTGDYARISIRDTGIGMNDDIKEHIFEPFFTTKEKEKGTGLGLSSSFNIIKNHSGLIRVYSEIGKGSEFVIYLPLFERNVVKVESYAEGEEEFKKGEGRVLIVDDEDNIRLSGEELLVKIGYTVFSAGNAKEALEFLKRNKVDLVILDMIMPEIGGKETFYSIRRLYPEMKVIVSSGFSEDESALQMLKDGAHSFVQKPFRLKELSDSVYDALNLNDFKGE